jgi:glycogen operon protein
MLLLNAHHEAVPFRIAGILSGKPWTAVLDTSQAEPFELRPLQGSEVYPLQARSLVLLQELAL